LLIRYLIAPVLILIFFGGCSSKNPEGFFITDKNKFCAFALKSFATNDVKRYSLLLENIQDLEHAKKHVVRYIAKGDTGKNVKYLKRSMKDWDKIKALKIKKYARNRAWMLSDFKYIYKLGITAGWDWNKVVLCKCKSDLGQNISASPYKIQRTKITMYLAQAGKTYRIGAVVNVFEGRGIRLTSPPLWGRPVKRENMKAIEAEIKSLTYIIKAFGPNSNAAEEHIKTLNKLMAKQARIQKAKKECAD